MLPNDFLPLSRRHATVAGAASLLGLHGLARAEDTSTVRIEVGFGSGGSIDVVARLVAERITTLGKRSFIVENRTGAAGNIATQAVLNAPADGKMVLMATLPYIVNPFLYPKVRYDPIKDFVPTVMIARSPVVMCVRADSPWHTIQEFVAAARAKPGSLNYSSAGIGSNPHMAAELFCKQTGIQAVHVPFRAGSQAITALLAGEVQFAFNTSLAVAAQIKAGQLRPLVVTGKQRNPELPTVPTVAESVIPGFEFTTWWGLLYAKGTNPATVDGLNKLVNEALKDPDVRAQLAKQGGSIVGGPPSVLAQAIRSDSERLGQLIKERGLKGE